MNKVDLNLQDLSEATIKKRIAYGAGVLSIRSSVDKNSKKIIRSKIIILFGAALISILILLFHKEEHLKATFELVQPDRISVLYLKLLVSMKPEDGSLRLALARQHAKLGEVNEAYLVLEPFSQQHGPEAIEGQLLSVELDLNRYFAKAPTDPSKANDLAALKRKIGTIADQPITDGLFPSVIKRGLELGRPELAAKLYERWASMDSQHSFERIQEAGRWYVAAGKPLFAAEIYKKAYASTHDAGLAKKFALLAIKAMQAADKAPLTLAFIKAYVQRYPNDAALLDEAIKLSLATNDQKQALSWGNLRLAISPNNPEQLNKQIELALAAGDLDFAWSLSKKALMLKPNDILIHKRSAEIAEWSGKQALALNHWQWLFKQDIANEKALENTLRLADGLKSGETTIAVLTALSERRAFSDTELNYLVNASRNVDYSNKAIALLQSSLVRYPTERGAWEALAKVEDNAGQLKQALATWNYIGAHFGQPLIAVTHQADLLRRTGKPDSAFSKLVLNQHRAPADDIGFWRLYGDISWEQKRTGNALLAYWILCKSSPEDMLATERFIQLLRDTAQGQDAVAIAHRAFQRFNQPRWLLLAMDSAVQFKLWNELRHLLQTVDADKKQFERLEMYWLIRAQLNIHDQRPYQALEDYRRAHVVNPASKIAQDGGLWTLIDLQKEAVKRISISSQRFSSTLASKCVYQTGFSGSVCEDE